VVVTEDRTAGADAAELVFVDYDPLPATPDPRRTLAGEITLFPEIGTNVAMHEGPEELDETLFAGCEVVVSGTIVSQRLAPVPLEARSSAAVVGEDGRLTVYLSTQTPHQDRDGLARFLGLEADQLRVVAPDVGGGFGAKLLAVEDVLVAWLARKTGRVVRWTESRSENMVGMHHGRDRDPRDHDRRHERGRDRGVPARHHPEHRCVRRYRRFPPPSHGADGERCLRHPEDRGAGRTQW